MHVEEEVELTIQLHVPDMQASTREEMVITENISSIVAIAFDESGDLIKKVDAILSDQDHENHSGTLKIKVPKRTQTIHFLGNYTKNDIESITSLETLNSFTTNDVTTMRYWGKAEYNGGNNLSVTLHRNMAKLTLKKGDGFTANSCYIAGFVNRNLSGTIVPSGYAVGDTPTIPNGVTTHTYTADNSLGNVYYLFEHANVENSNPLYVIIEVAAKYYKVAFAAGDEYFPIIRNHEYTITIDGIDAMYAENNYTDAVNSQYPINDLVITSVPMTVTASPTEVLNESNQTFTVTVTIPEGITELNVPTHDAFDITPPNSLTPQNGKYTVTQGNYEFTFTVKEGVEAGDKTISFSGRGKYKSATGSATVTLEDKKTVSIVAVPSATTLNYAASSVEDLLVNVTIQKEVTGLTFSSSDFTIKVVGNELQPTEGVYPITHDENATETTIPVRIRLNDGVDKETASFTFDGTSNDANVEVQEDTKEITLTAADDANVRWQGDAALQWGINAVQIPLLYSWFYDANNQLIIPVGSTLRVEYETLGNDASIQFAECNGTWNDDAYYFSELHAEYNNNGNNETMGLNLDNNTGIYNGTSKDLVLTQAVLDNMKENRTNLLGENDIVMAIQGGNVTLKKISVIPATENPNNPLSIELDFYADSENLGNGATYSNLALNSSHFYLKATVTGDLSAYHGQPVQLQGAFSSPYQYSNSNEAIHWTNSRQTDSSISYYGERIDGKGLQFTIDSTKDVYIIDWVFQTGSLYTGYGDIQFTYTLSNNQGHSITGDTSATIAFTNEPVGIVLLNSQHQFETQDNGYWTSLTFDGPFPIGTKIILTFSEGGGIKLCDGSNNNLYVPAFASNNLYGNGGNSDLWMTAPTGNLVLDITEEIILYGKGTGTNNGNLSANNPLNRLIIESGATVLDKVVVVYPEGYVEEEEVIVNIDFRTYNQWTLWCQPDDESASNYRKPTVDSQNGFCLSNPEKCSESEGWLPQYHLANGLTLETGTYKITMKIRGSVAGQIDRVGLGSWEDGVGQTYSDSPMTFTTEWQEQTVEVSLTTATGEGQGFVMCQSGSFIGDLYIQTLKVVRSD